MDDEESCFIQGCDGLVKVSCEQGLGACEDHEQLFYEQVMGGGF